MCLWICSLTIVLVSSASGKNATLFTLLVYYSSGYFAFGLNHQTWLLHPVFPSELKMTHSEISFSRGSLGKPDIFDVQHCSDLFQADKLRIGENMSTQRDISTSSHLIWH